MSQGKMGRHPTNAVERLPGHHELCLLSGITIYLFQEFKHIVVLGVALTNGAVSGWPARAPTPLELAGKQRLLPAFKPAVAKAARPEAWVHRSNTLLNIP